MCLLFFQLSLLWMNVYQKLVTRLRQMTYEYCDKHCRAIGCEVPEKARPSSATPSLSRSPQTPVGCSKSAPDVTTANNRAALNGHCYTIEPVELFPCLPQGSNDGLDLKRKLPDQPKDHPSKNIKLDSIHNRKKMAMMQENKKLKDKITYRKKLNEEGSLVLTGIESKLSRNLPPDLQKLRSKVAFHALKFAKPISELGNRIARRMWIEGPYVAIHLRLEKDVWVRTGCLTGLGSDYDSIIEAERESNPEFPTTKSNISCPLNSLEAARLLKESGAPENSRVYIAGGEPFGGDRAILPLKSEFVNVVTKEMLARNDELNPYKNRTAILTAIDYIVSLSSVVFLPSYDGHMV